MRLKRVILSRTTHWWLHGFFILYDVVNAAVIAHLQSADSPFRLEHPVTAELGHHAIYHRLGCERLAA
jgi:hypothetical protein